MKISLDHFSSHQLEEQGFDLTFVVQLSNREELPGFILHQFPGCLWMRASLDVLLTVVTGFLICIACNWGGEYDQLLLSANAL